MGQLEMILGLEPDNSTNFLVSVPDVWNTGPRGLLISNFQYGESVSIFGVQQQSSGMEPPES